MTPRNNSVEARVSRLETTNRLLVLTLLLGIGFAAHGVSDDAPTVRAEAIQLIGPEGRLAAELSIRDGTPGLYLMDEKGKTRLSLFHSLEATGLYVSDEDEVTRVGVAQFAHGGGGVALHGPGSKGAAVLYLKKSGSLRFFDDDGHVTFLLPPTNP